MTSVSVHEAKTHLSRLIEKVLGGEEVVITRRNRVVARIVPPQSLQKKPLLGAFKGQVLIDDRFFEPLPEGELTAWEGD
jgi:prevent-host-death family protein